MAVTIEETVRNALRGQLSEQTRLPAPKLIKIYISSRKRGKYSHTPLGRGDYQASALAEFTSEHIRWEIQLTQRYGSVELIECVVNPGINLMPGEREYGMINYGIARLLLSSVQACRPTDIGDEH